MEVYPICKSVHPEEEEVNIKTPFLCLKEMGFIFSRP
jgi:hypothetical protein